MNNKILFLLLALGLILCVFFPLGSNVLTAVVYLSPFFLAVFLKLMFPPYVTTLSLEDRAIINTEKWKSMIRSAIQLVGVLVALAAFGINIPYVDIVSQALQYISGEIDVLVEAIQLLIGFGLTVYGFFKNDERFQSRLTSGKRLK